MYEMREIKKACYLGIKVETFLLRCGCNVLAQVSLQGNVDEWIDDAQEIVSEAEITERPA